MNKFKIIISLLVITLLTSINIAQAIDGDNLLQLDVKKSQTSSDTVDVTLYTTSSSDTSVVTRKSANRYVVLLPNTKSETKNYTPSNAVKDLVTNIDVKHVDDGMGGYTKIVFDTTRPINIKTSNKRMANFSQAQKDVKVAINNANNISKVVAVQNTKPSVTPVAANKTTSTAVASASLTSKPIEQHKSLTVKDLLQKVKENNYNIIPSTNIVNVPKNVKPIVTDTKTVKTETTDLIQKKTNNTKANEIITTNVNKEQTKVSTTITPKQIETDNIKKENTVNINKNEKKATPHLPKRKILLFLTGIIALITTLKCIKIAIVKKSKKPHKKPISMETVANYNKQWNEDLANNSSLTWQEKYKMISNMENSIEAESAKNNMQFVANLQKDKQNNKDINKNEIEIIVDNKLNIQGAQSKLKCFSKTSTERNSYKMVTNTMHMKFKETLLKSKKTSGINKNNIFSKINNSGEMIMQKNSDTYVDTSLNEYLSVLDKKHTNDIAQNSRVTNPIARTSAIPKAIANTNSSLLIVSKHKIDANKWIYLVIKNKKSAIVGKIDNEVYTIKNFDRIIDENMQVRPDGNNVYIVKAGGYKCLVEVRNNKMGMLLEI